ncbi:hypothetical protein U1Q18_050740, partial [Sarracenia purpurea var. burkii]
AYIVRCWILCWQVKLVKCIVQNIVVDISFNQLGGLCTLCFLEQVDRLIGKDHLFKRSIILIKAWCYYESRILGAHHGLISTYALETLVLYIFHRFHSKLNGPLAVLYRFLDYFSKFDWDNYCVSLIGPVCISSLPDIMAEKPENNGIDLLLSHDFLRYCVDMFSVPSRGVDSNSRTFPQKHFNIVDPLKENNNLGRSVSKGNFFRIRSAFTYGAKKLGRILFQPEDDIAGELCKFFSNTLDRHGSGQRPDVQDPVPMSGEDGFVPSSSFSDPDSSQEGKAIPESNGTCKLDPEGSSSHNGGNNIGLSGMEMKIGRTVSGNQKPSMKVVNTRSLSQTDMGYRFSGDAEDLSTSTSPNSNVSNDKPKAFRPSDEESISQLGIAHHAPHLYFSGSLSGNGKLGYRNPNTKEVENPNGKLGYGNLNMKEVEYSNLTGETVSSGLLSVPEGGAICSPENLNFLSDLGGDYDSYFNSLQYCRLWYENSSSMPPAFLVPPALLSQFQTKIPLDAIQHSHQFKQNGFHNLHANGVIPRPALYRMNTMLMPAAASFGVEEMSKPRGTGTYIPNANRPPYRKPFLTGRGRNQGPARSPRNNGWAATPMEANFLDSARELSQAQFFDQGSGRPGSLVFYDSGSPGGKVRPVANGLLQSEGIVEFGPVGHGPLEVPLLESSRQLNPASFLTQNPPQSLLTLGMQKVEPALGMNHEDRVMAKSSYRLKDEDDFPPLSF